MNYLNYKQKKNKMKLLFTMFTLGLLVAVGSCDKPVYKYNSNFEGTWRTVTQFDSTFNKIVTSEIVIDGRDGRFSYACETICGSELCDCNITQVGKAVMNSTKTQLKIGSTSSFPLTIEQEPYQDNNGTWKMKVYGLTFIKQ